MTFRVSMAMESRYHGGASRPAACARGIDLTNSGIGSGLEK